MAASTTEGSSSPDDTREEGDKNTGSFECNICYETATEAVVSLCGHLFWLAMV